MKPNLKKEPRVFSPTSDTEIKDWGEILLDTDEQISLVSSTGKKHDVTRKEWGWYLANSVNSSLKRQGYKTALVISHMAADIKVMINLVDDDKVDDFLGYLNENKSVFVCWLDEWAS